MLASELLEDILLYHVLPIEADSQLVATLDGQSVDTALAGETVDVTVEGGAIMVDQTEVVSPDLVAENGIVHVINAVLIPDVAVEAFGLAADDEEMTEESTTTTAAPEEGPGTIVDVATEAGFTTLVAAVEAAGLTDALSDPDATLTVFAPTDDAFEAALADLGVSAEDLLAGDGVIHVIDNVILPAAPA